MGHIILLHLLSAAPYHLGIATVSKRRAAAMRCTGRAHGHGGAGRRSPNGPRDTAAVAAAARQRCTAVQQRRQRCNVYNRDRRGTDAASVPVCIIDRMAQAAVDPSN